ncbi:unnamed protein product [Ceutorhynchus assimilis]|uniref:Uncharacterized protein n=1 Tax=Ceutorhynchus assimilis TaxID=467358 RepID=A0A9N9MZ58_9CUCU|nr:unnamed protein product [Ceutorhynchus assimilis]
MKQQILLALLLTTKAALVLSLCEDWTTCHRVKCALPPNPCPRNEPYLIWDDCGCCQHCSEKPKVGPCGTCGKDVICKEKEPICGENQTVTIDYCGCCKVCKTIVDVGCGCSACGQSSTVCAPGLECFRGTCQKLCVCEV